jgi:hypothetical protein
MKTLAGLAVVALSLFLNSFRPIFSLDDVATAIRSGDVSNLSPYLDNRVDITLPTKSDTYSRNQAEMIIRDFFSTNGVKNFQIKQRGEQGAGTLYCVGELQTQNGNFRTMLFLKQKGDKQYLQELRFQPAQ